MENLTCMGGSKNPWHTVFSKWRINCSFGLINEEWQSCKDEILFVIQMPCWCKYMYTFSFERCGNVLPSRRYPKTLCRVFHLWVGKVSWIAPPLCGCCVWTLRWPRTTDSHKPQSPYSRTTMHTKECHIHSCISMSILGGPLFFALCEKMVGVQLKAVCYYISCTSHLNPIGTSNFSTIKL